MIIDYLIPVLMIISYPWWMKIASGEISKNPALELVNQ